MMAAIEKRVDEHDTHVDARIAEAVQAMLDELPSKIAEAMERTVTDRAVITRVLDTSADVIQQRAAEAAGRGMGKALRGVFTHWLVIAVILLAVAKLAGLDAAARLWAMFTK